MPLPFKPFDAILLTHIHYDHVGGIDDLRPFSVFGPIRLYGDAKTCSHVRNIMPYCFGDHLYPGVPKLELHTLTPHAPLCVGDLRLMPIEVMHGKMPILGFRIGSFAYITDMKTIGDGELPYLEGVETLVVNALRFEKEHHSHQLVAQGRRGATQPCSETGTNGKPWRRCLRRRFVGLETIPQIPGRCFPLRKLRKEKEAQITLPAPKMPTIVSI